MGPRRTLTWEQRNSPNWRRLLADGEYAFVEFYCNEPGCDCRRVLIHVLESKTGWSKVWAAINYGWESPDFYRRWGAHKDDSSSRPFLDPLNPQSEYSVPLIDLFEAVVLKSPGYIERLKRHYEMFRAFVDGISFAKIQDEKNRIENRRKRLRAASRRRRR